jgi:hypothetical protein
MTQTLINPASDLSTKIWKTRGARLNAYRRLNTRAKLSLYLISIYSAYALLASIFEKKLSTTLFKTPDDLNIILISLSLFILITSIIEGTSRNEVTAHNLHENAKKLTPLITKLEILKNTTPSEELTHQIKKINKKYSAIINSCSDNHSPTDYDKFRIKHTELKSPTDQAWLINVKYYLSTIIFAIAVITPILVAITLALIK